MFQGFFKLGGGENIRKQHISLLFSVVITPSTSSAGYPFPCFNTTTTRRREREVVLIDKRKTLSKSKFVFFNSLLLLF